ncbi:hypothetical protein CSC67_10460 [Pusillimonas caeni]|nr:hypothetical protein CSC67_10460 [Pusillimonas caeni]
MISEEMNATVIVVILPPGRPKAKSAPSGGSKQARACAAWGLFCRRAAPRQKAPPRGQQAGASLRSVGAFLPPGRPKVRRLANPSGMQAARRTASRRSLRNAGAFSSPCSVRGRPCRPTMSMCTIL